MHSFQVDITTLISRVELIRKLVNVAQNVVGGSGEKERKLT